MSDIDFDTDTGNTGLRISVFNEQDGSTTDLLFSQFPVRIGRNQRNDLVLRHEYVSQWHAVVGFINGNFSVVQVGTSNSARLGDRKLVPNEVVAMPSAGTLRIVPFRLQLRLVTVPDRLRRNTATIPGPEPLPSLPRVDETAQLQQESYTSLDALARRFWGRGLQTQQEVHLLGTRLEEVLDVFMRSFVALQGAQQQFRKEMEIKVPVAGAHPVQQARSAEELGAALMSPADRGAAAALGEALEALSMHSVALLQGFEAGVRTLLKKISPAGVAKAVDKQSQRQTPKSLWDTYVLLYGDLAEEGAARFKVIYGSQFRRAYMRLLRGKKR
jgi:hypothetical protein